MQSGQWKRRAGALGSGAAMLAALIAAPTAPGHSADLTGAELAQEVGVSPEAALLEQPDMAIGEPTTLQAANMASWYQREPIPPRIGSSDADRYSLAGGCFALEGVEDAEVYRFQPTGLGSYLLLGSDGQFPAVKGGELTSVEAPARNAEWVVEGDGANGFTLTSRSGEALDLKTATDALGLNRSGESFALSAAPECASFPEIAVNSTGRPQTVSPSYAEASGTIDLHSHMMAFEAFGGGFHCGRPWHPLGVAEALQDCPDHAPNGLGATEANLLVFQDPTKMHDPSGWPDFEGWPTFDWVFTHEQTYYRWIERAWRGGLRLVTLLAVDNSAVCLVNDQKTESCNEMDAVRRQIAATKELQDYIDAQWGGPGKGFFRIVRNPFQARKVMNRGKLAVVMGIEVSEPLDCGIRNGVSQCDENDVDEELDAVFKSGVRQMEIVNKFDNAFTGVAMDGGGSGPVVNSANKLVTGEYWDVETCTGPDSDREQITSVPPAAATLISLLPGGPAQLPVYPPPPHCNTRGLTDLGRHLIRGMAKRKMIFDPDHMSVYARRSALDVIDALNYSGIVSSHSWSDRSSYKRIMQLGGVVTPMAGHADEFDNDWAFQRELYKEGKRRSRKYGFGFGFGDDMNGFGGPRNPTAGTDAEISYPFNSPIHPRVSFDRQQSGTQTYDLNEDGVAHFGHWPDWTEGVQRDAGNKVIRDLRNGAESYLRMWERAVGVRGPNRKKKHGHFRASGLRQMQLGMSPKRLLSRAGQPDRRTRGWTWRVRGAKGARIGAAFGRKARVGLIATNARTYRADGIRPGAGTRALRRVADSIGGGVWTGDAGKNKSFIYGVRNGRVSYVGVATSTLASRPGRVAKAARLAMRTR